MENAAEALKYGAWILIIVTALSMCINSLTEARQTIDTILTYNDKEYDYSYIPESGETRRVVGAESIVPAIYRAYKENYKIIFNFKSDSDVKKTSIYQKTIDASGTIENIRFIDLEQENIAGDSMKEDFLKRILFGDNNTDNVFPNYTFYNGEYTLYKKLENKKFYEYLGVYYQDEVSSDDEDTYPDETDSNEENQAPDANKIKKRVITYEEI